MTIAWFIDAIDVRGGLAVATRRGGNLMSDNLPDEGPSAFLSGPSFVPEIIGSRATGLGLARGYAQLGLFTEAGSEVPFDSLDAVAEFIRRAYLSGSGGDGPGESGSSPPPVAPEGGEPPEFERFERGETDPVMALLRLGKQNRALSANLEVGMSKPAAELGDAIETRGSGGERLARGALQVLWELARRQPQSDADRLRWAQAFEKFLLVVAGMGLPALMTKTCGGSPYKWAFYSHDQNPAAERAFDLLWDRWLYGWPYDTLWRRRFRTSDTFDDLASFPVSRFSRPQAQPDSQNLQAFLSSATANPDLAFASLGPRISELNAELALFAAACLISNYMEAPLFWIETEVEHAHFVDDLVHGANKWLQQNVPSLVYASPVEAMIASALFVSA